MLILPKNKCVLANLAGLRYASVADWNIFVISLKTGIQKSKKLLSGFPIELRMTAALLARITTVGEINRV